MLYSFFVKEQRKIKTKLKTTECCAYYKINTERTQNSSKDAKAEDNYLSVVNKDKATLTIYYEKMKEKIKKHTKTCNKTVKELTSLFPGRRHRC